MRLHVKDRFDKSGFDKGNFDKRSFDPILLELSAIAILMAVLGGALYYYGYLYSSHVEVTHVMRYPSGF